MKPPFLLVVDDDPGIARLLVSLLEEEGYEADAAHSGAAATARILDRPPDLLLLDLRLGDTDATAFLTGLREHGIELPFLCISGQGDERTAVEMMKLGALEYLLKDTQLVHFVPAVAAKALAHVEMQRRLADSEQERRRLESELIETSERERRSIGHDLHDGLGQRLSALALMSHALCEQLKTEHTRRQNPPGKCLDVAQRISTGLREAIGETRRLARGLAPIAIETDGLSSALQALADDVHGGGPVRVEFICPEPIPIADAAAGHLYRIAQEAMNNALKHSGGKTIRLGLERRDGTIELTIADDGSGVPDIPAAAPGMGLRVMNYRAHLIGAQLEITRNQHGGTTIKCVLPLQL